ncbi:hypothetical protein [Alkaliphilus peptidifermentans]|nr:hypothetical protein [Alkaliphilus peptidifermentans]
MKRKLIITICIVIAVVISGCTNKSIDSFKDEKDHLINKILELEEQVSQKEDDIKRLQDLNTKLTIEIKELEESFIMSRFSSYAMLKDKYDSFENLKNIYNINAKYKIKDDWYVLDDEYFKLELIGYKNAKKVDFYFLRMESDQGEELIFTDNDPSDGWIYTNDSISEIIEKHIKAPKGKFSYEPYFVLYTKVTLENGEITQTLKLPIYYE